MMTRRGFLSHTCSLGIASATVTSSLLSLGLARTAAAQGAPDYRALVCILLAGGKQDAYERSVIRQRVGGGVPREREADAGRRDRQRGRADAARVAE